MGVYESQKEVVASPVNNCFIVNRDLDSHRGKFCYRAVYIYLILKR